MKASISIKYPGDLAFDSLLKKAKSIMNVNDLRAYLMGCILSPTFVMPSHVLKYYLLNEKERPLEFKNKKEASAFFSAFMGLWNEMADYQFSQTMFQFSPLKGPFDTAKALKLAVGVRIGEMCQFLDGFLQGQLEEGYEYDPNKLDALALPGVLDVSIQDILNQIETFNELGWNKDRQDKLLALVKKTEANFESTLKRHLIENGKGFNNAGREAQLN